MHYVYLLHSESVTGQRYIGVTSDLKQRLAVHNAGKSPHTSKYLPWKLVTYVAFSEKSHHLRALPEIRFRPRVRQEKAMVANGETRLDNTGYYMRSKSSPSHDNLAHGLNPLSKAR